MLKAPAFKEVNDVTIFQDDTIWYKFYPIAAFPTVRSDRNGKPVFLLVKYEISEDEREANSKLPIGGGYINFDTQLEVSADDLAVIQADLQTWVNEEFGRLRAGSADDQAKVAGMTAAPTVTFGTPTWTNGTVTMSAPQTALLVTDRVAQGTPSLLANNIAVFSMDLTADGAQFMEQTLVSPSGQGATDLTPLQVAYDLKFWARMPPATVHVEVDSKQAHTQVSDQCPNADWRSNWWETYRDTAESTGIIKVKIDNADGKLGPEELNALRSFALDMVKELIEKKFFEADDALPTDHDDSDNTRSNAPRRWQFKSNYSEASMSIKFDLEQSEVVEWHIAPQATLETFFKGVKKETLSQYIRKVHLDDPFFKNINVTVRANADYKDPEIQDVVVELAYAATDENGQPHEDGHTFTFTSSDPQTWTTDMIGGKREYRYRWRVDFRNREPGTFSTWVTSASDALNLSIIAPGRVAVDIIAGAIDWANLVDRIDVLLTYADPAHGVPSSPFPIPLTATKLQDHHEWLIYQPWTQPISYQTTFTLKDGRPPIVMPQQWTASPAQTVIPIQSPADSSLKVNLFPTGNGWDEVVLVSVDLSYDDSGNDYSVVDNLILKNNQDLRTWKVPLRDKHQLGFSYQTHVSYKTNSTHSGWHKVPNDDYMVTLPITIDSSFTGTKVKVCPLAPQSGVIFPLTEVTLECTMAGAATHRTTLVFNDATQQTWLLPDIPGDAPIDYSYTVIFHPAGSESQTLPTMEHQKNATIILPQYKPPTAGKLPISVRSFADFNATPLVVVDMIYDDTNSNARQSGSVQLDKAGPQVWQVDAKDINQPGQVTFTFTYYGADGSQLLATEPTRQLATRPIIVPKAAAAQHA